MTNGKIYEYSFSKVYSLLLSKIERKGRSESELNEVIIWLTGYTEEMLTELLVNDIGYGDFFLNAPQLNSQRKLIVGKICGVNIEDIKGLLCKKSVILINWLTNYIKENQLKKY